MRSGLLKKILWGLAIVLNACALTLVFNYAPLEVTMGRVQKIFYYHVPSAITAYILLAVAFIFSVLYLWKEKNSFDVIAHCVVEVAWVFMTVVITTGPIWGRAAWGAWWVWEPRLTSFLILWLMYSAYLLVRLFGGRETGTAKIAAVVAVIAFIDVPIVHMAIKWWGSVVHPPHVELAHPMKVTFAVSALAVFSLAAAMTVTRSSLGLARMREKKDGGDGR